MFNDVVHTVVSEVAERIGSNPYSPQPVRIAKAGTEMSAFSMQRSITLVSTQGVAMPPLARVFTNFINSANVRLADALGNMVTGSFDPVSRLHAARMIAGSVILMNSVGADVRRMVGVVVEMLNQYRPSKNLWLECRCENGDPYRVAGMLSPVLSQLADQVTNGHRSRIAMGLSSEIDDGLAVAALAEFLGDKSCAVKQDVEKQLIKICAKSEAAMKALFFTAKNGSTWEIRRRAARLFERVAIYEVISAKQQELVRRLALEGVKGYGDHKTRNRLQFLRIASMKILSSFGAARYADVFVRLSREGTGEDGKGLVGDSIIRFESLRFLGWIAASSDGAKDVIAFRDGKYVDSWRTRTRKMVDAIIARMKDERSFVRRKAAEVVGKYTIVDAMKPLTGLLKDPSSWVREVAARSLAKIGDVTVLPALRAAYEYAATKKDKRVMYATKFAIMKIREGDGSKGSHFYVDLRPLAG